jgi:hypothetical protein
MVDAFWPLLAESLALLAHHQPLLYRRLAETLHDVELELTIDGTTAALRWQDGVHSIGPPRTPSVQVHTQRAAILAIVDGARTLPESLRRDDLRVVAPLPQLLVAFDGLVLYLNGVARLIEASRLLHRYRAAILPPPQG